MCSTLGLAHGSTLNLDTLIRRFAKRLYGLRTERGLTQEALAAKARLHPSYISALERGAKVPGLSVLEQLAEGLGIELPVLVDFPETPAAPDDRVADEIALIGRSLKKCDLATVRKARKQIEVLVAP